MSSYWQNLCSEARTRSLPSQIIVVHVVNGILVCPLRCSSITFSGFFFLVSPSDPRALQIAAFIVCALLQGCAFVRWRQKWRKLSGEQRSSGRGWKLYEGWFCGLACIGSVIGALAYGARLGNLLQAFVVNTLEADMRASGNSTVPQLLRIEREYSTRHRFAAAFYVLFPWEVALVVAVKLFVLKRMWDFALGRSAAQGRLRVWAERVYVAVVVAGNVSGIISNLVSAAWFSESADFSDEAVHAFAINNAADGRALTLQARASVQRAGTNNAIQRFLEALVLLVIVAGYSVVGVRSFRIIAAAVRKLFVASVRLKEMQGVAGEQSRQLVEQASELAHLLQRKIVITFVFVFLATLLRAAFYVLYAVASAFQNIGDSCGFSCDSCRNVFAHIHDWILCVSGLATDSFCNILRRYTPAFQQVVMLIASPTMMLVALWGMSGVNELEDMAANLAHRQEEGSAAAGNSSSNCNSSNRSAAGGHVGRR
jgi:hypothetical protein